jgi:histidine decarboxylase
MKKAFNIDRCTATEKKCCDAAVSILTEMAPGPVEYIHHSEKNKNINFDSIQSKLDKIYTDIQTRRELSLGYPVNQRFNYDPIAPFLNFHLNNAGDPYAASSTLLNTRNLEHEVLEYFANLWNAKPRTPLISESFWGYVLGMGSTEGNMYALWSAREYFRAKLISSESDSVMTRHPVLYFSQESHYSIEKCAKILEIATFQATGNQCYPGQCPITVDGNWPQGVPVDEHGAVNPKLLSVLVDFFTANGHPPIIVLNVGTTFQGAFDTPRVVWQHLSHVLERRGFCFQTDGDSRPDFWIHIDGALGAAYLPYLEMAYKKELIQEKGPCFDFRLPCVNSIVMSSHKWYGAPFASGIYMSKEKYRMRPATLPEYIDSPDTTLCGSRNGLSTLLLWYAVNTMTTGMQAETAASCMQLAEYAYEQLQTVKIVHGSFQVKKGPRSLVVLFTRPNDRIFQQFQLSGRGDYAHIVIMPHVRQEAVDALITALQEEDAFS